MPELTPEQFDAAMQEQYPLIPWREPMPIHITSGYGGLGCRLCMARMGFKATEAREKLFQTKNEFDAHMREKHGDGKVPQQA